MRIIARVISNVLRLSFVIEKVPLVVTWLSSEMTWFFSWIVLSLIGLMIYL